MKKTFVQRKIKLIKAYSTEELELEINSLPYDGSICNDWIQYIAVIFYNQE